MLDILKDCHNCFLLSLIEKHLNEPIIYYNFLLRKDFETYQVYYTILLLLNLFLFLITFSVFFNDFFQTACLQQVSS